MEFTELEIFQSLLDYCYTGIISKQEYVYMYNIYKVFKFIHLLNLLGWSMKNIYAIMRLAKFLKMTPTIEICEEELKKKIDFLNCISTWRLAKSEKLENWTNFAFEYARQNFEKVFSSHFHLKFSFFSHNYTPHQ